MRRALAIAALAAAVPAAAFWVLRPPAGEPAPLQPAPGGADHSGAMGQPPAGDRGMPAQAPVHVPGPPEAPARVAGLVAPADPEDVKALLEAARRLPAVLAREEQEALEDFIPRISHLPGAPPQSRRLLAEMVFAALRRGGGPGVGEALGRAMRDGSADPVVREYAVQHLGIWLEDRGPGPEAENLLWEAAGVRGLAMSGTALLALGRLAGAGGGDRRLPGECLDALGDAGSSAPTRMAALDVLSRRGDARCLPHARRLARDGETLPLRLAATAALGRLAGPDDRELLDELASLGGPGRSAAEHALKETTERNDGR